MSCSGKFSSSKLLVLVFLVTCLFIFTLKSCAASSTELGAFFGGSSNDLTAGIIQTIDGGYVVAGTTYSLGAGSADFWLIKLDATGKMEWNNTYGGAQTDIATDIIQTRDEGYAIAGKTSSFGVGVSNFWLVKVDSFGNVQWNQTYGQTTTGATSLIQTSDGGYALVGYQEADSNRSALFVKTDSFGKMQWNQTYGEESSRENVYSIVQLSDGGYVFVGATNANSGDLAYDGWLVRTDSNGVMQWNKTYDLNGGFDYLQALVQTSDGGFTLAGNTGGFFLQDMWIVKTDENGNAVWNTIWETPEPAYCNSLIQTNDGGYIITGATDSRAGYFHSYMFLIKVDVDGNIHWNSTYDGLGDNKALFAVEINDGGYAMAGTTRSTDEGAHYDIWFARVDASGAIIPEFPSWTPMLILLTLLAVALAIYKRRLPKN